MPIKLPLSFSLRPKFRPEMLYILAAAILSGSSDQEEPIIVLSEAEADDSDIDNPIMESPSEARQVFFWIGLGVMVTMSSIEKFCTVILNLCVGERVVEVRVTGAGLDAEESANL
jgi:hypothetical protein